MSIQYESQESLIYKSGGMVQKAILLREIKTWDGGPPLEIGDTVFVMLASGGRYHYGRTGRIGTSVISNVLGFGLVENWDIRII